jgi:hypothetical protein
MSLGSYACEAAPLTNLPRARGQQSEPAGGAARQIRVLLGCGHRGACRRAGPPVAQEVRRLWSGRGNDEAVADLRLCQLQQSGVLALSAARLQVCCEPGQSGIDRGLAGLGNSGIPACSAGLRWASGRRQKARGEAGRRSRAHRQRSDDRIGQQRHEPVDRHRQSRVGCPVQS